MACVKRADMLNIKTWQVLRYTDLSHWLEFQVRTSHGAVCCLFSSITISWGFAMTLTVGPHMDETLSADRKSFTGTIECSQATELLAEFGNSRSGTRPVQTCLETSCQCSKQHALL